MMRFACHIVVLKHKNMLIRMGHGIQFGFMQNVTVRAKINPRGQLKKLMVFQVLDDLVKGVLVLSTKCALWMVIIDSSVEAQVPSITGVTRFGFI